MSCRARAVIATVLLLGAVAALPVVGADAREPYRSAGTAITGGDDAGAARALAPGSYVDTLQRVATSAADPGTSRYYAITVAAGQTPYVAATLAAPSGLTDPAGVEGSLAVRVTLTARGDDSACAQDSATDFGSDDRLGPVTVLAAPGPARRASDETTDGCPAGTLIVRVTRTGEALRDDPLQVELAYRLEPAVTTTSGLPSATTDAPALRADLTGEPATLQSGRSFADAPEVGSGIYRDRIGANDTRIVRVRLGWGQRFAYTVTAAGGSGVDTDDALGVSATIRTPVRATAAQSADAQPQAFSVGAEDRTLSGATLVPVRYANRDSEDADVTAYSLAGDYYLVLASDVPDSGSTSATYPYTLQVQVSGDEHAAPAYATPSAGSVDAAPAETGGSSPTVAFAVGGALLAVAVVLAVLGLRGGRQRRVHT